MCSKQGSVGGEGERERKKAESYPRKHEEKEKGLLRSYFL
jgi:hypothetical protein